MNIVPNKHEALDYEDYNSIYIPITPTKYTELEMSDSDFNDFVAPAEVRTLLYNTSHKVLGANKDGFERK